MSKAVELGFGWGPAIAAHLGGFVVAWRHPVDHQEPVLAFATIPKDPSAAPSPTTLLDGVSFSAPLALREVRGAVVAATCSDATRNEMVIVRDLLGKRIVDRVPTTHECDAVAMVVLATPPRLVAVVESVQPPFSEVFATEDPTQPLSRVASADVLCDSPSQR